MSGVRMLHFSNEWWKFIQIHLLVYLQNPLEKFFIFTIYQNCMAFNKFNL